MLARGLLAALALALATLLGPTRLQAQHPAGVSGQLSLATLETYPWAWQEGNATPPEGFLPDVVRELERRTGVAVQVHLMPFARLTPELESGRQDCAVFAWNKAAGAFALRGQTVAVHPVGVLPARSVTLGSYADLKGLTVAVLRGLRFAEPFQSDASVRKDEDPDYKTSLNKLALGRVDGVAGSVPTIRAVARSLGMLRQLGEPLVLDTYEIVLQISRNSGRIALARRLDQALADMRADGTLARIESVYYP
ncbi:substrate-binding periplasmic protein [Fundidesulfovibrio magnetotacticus]|nr:transporter substrate-binding domain-containing protein [Fundidesulfovibrio magnetotacticus]